jgi:hypothetical protein
VGYHGRINILCKDIDENDVELYVLGKLQDDRIRSHLATCPTCVPRVGECRDFIMACRDYYLAAMKEVFGETEEKN